MALTIVNLIQCPGFKRKIGEPVGHCDSDPRMICPLELGKKCEEYERWLVESQGVEQ